MFKKLPWLISRRKIILSCFNEIFIISILNKYFLSDYLLFSSSIFIFTIIFLPFWLSLNYISGRYSYDEDLYRSKNIVLFLKLFIKSIIIANLSIIFVLIFSININLNNYNHFDKMIFIYTFSLSLILNIVQIPIIKSFIKNVNKEDVWNFVGSESLFERINKEINFSRKKAKILLKRIESDFNYLDEKKIKGIFLEDIRSLENINTVKLFALKNSGFKIYTLEKWCEYYLQRLPANILNLEFLLNSESIIFNDSIQFRIKRFGDISLSIILLIFSLPILLISSLLIFLEDGKSCIYSQLRVGKNQKNFTLYKLRTMRIDAEKGTPQWSKKSDSRITKIGKFLRRTRIDELPQLLNVIIGDMSLIGPRPEREMIDKKLVRYINRYNYRYFVRPGLSGWAQVNYPYGSSIEDSNKKFSYDLYYLKNFSIWLDFLILIKTIKIVLLKRGSDPLR